MSIQGINGLSQVQNIQQLTDIAKNNLNQVSKDQFGDVFDDLLKNLVDRKSVV